MVTSVNRQKDQIKGYIHSTESFASVDGPGIRFLAFMQGCRMRCQFCHNPDTWKLTGGKEYTPQQLFDEAIKYRSFWGNNGGVTVSGGEPLLQPEFILEYFKLCKAQGIHTTIDTCGAPFTHEEPFFSVFEELMEYTDLLLYDIKHIDPKGHLKLTGHSNQPILEMARYLSNIKKPIWVRHVLVPYRTDYDEYLQRLSDFIQTLDNVHKVEILPYHKLGVYKYEALGIRYPLEGIEPPTADRVENARRILRCDQYTKYLTD
ncbi:pyruvate formate-lyase-activating protein [Falseniella ignava]|uniref:Pyruvate formate-lyase-activating enzyme n=1 Tax=Falseniella ignava CCUG 37419 TaxID=883112 RepID=K1MCK4_9LACT|nr:pyruvate formate-lyase-activating protein [Falseniella ignava]EKB53724.1 pyruvate formate-lyase 1-activating enzyme [Falseniella ignava CCUG 37419]